MNLFKNFINSIYSHFEIHTNLETITSVMEMIDYNPKHMLIIELDGLSRETLDQNLTAYDFLKVNQFLDFIDFPERTLSDYFIELKSDLNNRKNFKIHDVTVTYLEKHRRYKREINRIKKLSSYKDPSFALFKIIVPSHLQTEKNIKYLNETLSIFKDKVRDTFTFIIIKDSNKSKLLYAKSPKTLTLQDSPITNSRLDTGIIGWIAFWVLFSLIVIFILLKIY